MQTPQVKEEALLSCGLYPFRSDKRYQNHTNTLFLSVFLSAMTTLFAPSALVSFPKSKNCNRIHVGVSASSSSSSSSSRLCLTKTKVSELGFVTSQLGGLRISNDHSLPLKSLSFASPQPVLQPIIARNLSSPLYIFSYHLDFWFPYWHHWIYIKKKDVGFVRLLFCLVGFAAIAVKMVDDDDVFNLSFGFCPFLWDCWILDA